METPVWIENLMDEIKKEIPKSNPAFVKDTYNEKSYLIDLILDNNTFEIHFDINSDNKFITNVYLGYSDGNEVSIIHNQKEASQLITLLAILKPYFKS